MILARSLRLSMHPFFGLLFIWASLSTSSAQARQTRGPQLSYDQAALSAVTADDEKTGVKVARRRYVGNLLAPIPYPLLGGLFVAKFDFFKERRIYSGDTLSLTRDQENPNTAGAGLVYLMHAKEGAPHFFIVIERYGKMSLEHTVKPMSEYIIGADFHDDDLPLSLKFSKSDSSDTRILIRLRQFPGPYHKWLFLVTHAIETTSGFGLDIGIPSHAFVSWQAPSRKWKFQTGLRLESREWPISDGDQSHWLIGYTTAALVGVRRHLVGPLYLAIEGGQQKEVLEAVNENGETLGDTETAWAPWMKIAIQTWLESP